MARCVPTRRALPLLVSILCPGLFAQVGWADTACDPAAPGLLGHARSIAGDALGIDVQGAYAYVADWSGWLQVFEVANPCRPVLLPGAVSNPGNEIGDLDVHGRFAYVAADANGLRIYDVSNPRRPVFLAGRSDAWYAHSVLFDGRRYAYTGYIYGWSAPLAIYDTTRAPLRPPTIYRTHVGRDVYDAHVVGGRAYLITGDGEGSYSFQVVDVSSPRTPVLLAELPYHYTEYGQLGEVKVRGGHAFLSTGFETGGLLVIRVSDLNRLQVAAYVPMPNAGMIPWKGTGLDVAGDRAYVVARDGLHVFDVSAPENPVEETVLPFPDEFGTSDGGHVVVRNGLAYVTVYRHWPPTGHDHGGLAIYRVGGSHRTPPIITGRGRALPSPWIGQEAR